MVFRSGVEPEAEEIEPLAASAPSAVRERINLLKSLFFVLVALAATVLAVGVGTASADTASTCQPVFAHTEYKWVPDVSAAGPTQWTLDNKPANTQRFFTWKGAQVSYHRDGTKSQYINAVTCNVTEPMFNYNVNTCSVTVPYTPGLDTRLYGVNGYSQDTPITHDVTVTAGLDGVDGTTGQFWIGYTPQPGYVDTNPGAGTSHIDFYNGDLIPDCTAVTTLTGNNGDATLTTIPMTGTVLYAGTYKYGAVPGSGATVGLTVFQGHDCTGTSIYNDPTYTTTDASGNYSLESGTPPYSGPFSAETNVGSNLSNCINIDVTA